jgi:hypothetical protein
MSVESNILDNLETALRGILIANGYQTDAGVNVFVNLEYETAPDAELFPCIIMFPGQLSSGEDGDVPPCMGEQNNFLPVHIEAYALDDERGTEGRKIKEDLRKRVTAAGSFGGLVELVKDYKSAAEVQSAADSFRSYVDADFTFFYVTPWGES